jgi:hypothetical protein
MDTPMISPNERILSRISHGELERRWRLVRHAMLELKIDALVMQATNDWLGGYVKWFTDLPATNGYPRKEKGDALPVISAALESARAPAPVPA